MLLIPSGIKTWYMSLLLEGRTHAHACSRSVSCTPPPPFICLMSSPASRSIILAVRGTAPFCVAGTVAVPSSCGPQFTLGRARSRNLCIVKKTNIKSQIGDMSTVVYCELLTSYRHLNWYLRVVWLSIRFCNVSHYIYTHDWVAYMIQYNVHTFSDSIIHFLIVLSQYNVHTFPDSKFYFFIVFAHLKLIRRNINKDHRLKVRHANEWHIW